MLNAPQDLHAELVPTALPTALSSVRSCRQKCSLHSTKQARRDHGPLLASSIPVACMGPSRCHPGHWWTRWTSPPTATQEALPHMQPSQPTAQCRSANELPGQKSKDWENREKVCVEKNTKTTQRLTYWISCACISHSSSPAVVESSERRPQPTRQSCPPSLTVSAKNKVCITKALKCLQLLPQTQ